MLGLPSSNIDEIIEKYAKSQKRASEQKLKKEFDELISICEEQMQRENGNWQQEFGKLKTDFERVHFYLRHFPNLEKARKIFNDEVVQSERERLRRCNGKSDKVSELLLWLSQRKREELKPSTSLRFSTLAVFYASTDRQLSLALAQRSILLYENGLIDEAISDAHKALKSPLAKIPSAKLRICLGYCHKMRGNFAEANNNFAIALKVIRENRLTKNGSGYGKIYWRTIDAMAACDQNIPQEISPSIWRFHFSKAPKLSLPTHEININKDSDKSCLLLASNGSLKLKKCNGKKCEWKLESTRHINAGETILVDKAYAVALRKKRTQFCYTCFRHCLNLIPCPHCTHFGFCSKKCRKRATKVEHPRSTVNKHIYDCNGILPNILLDAFEGAQLAYMCIGNTDPRRLIDCLCRTGVYKKGRGHQAFRGTEKVRRIPPEIFDSSDYQSIAWTSTNSNELDIELLLQCTRIAIFLTFCLLIAGYPMDTKDSLWSTRDKPSSKNRPDQISVSWLAACVLHHLQSTSVTSFFLTQKIFYRLRSSLEFAQLNIGLIFYPTISLINHSCDPNALVLMSGNGAAGIIAFKPIPPNSEISICYLLPYWQVPRGMRRNLLSKSFFFLCKCEACAKNWRVVKDINTLILCPGCKKGSRNICKASLPAVNFYNKLVHKYLRKIERLKDQNDASSKSIAYVTKVINQIDSFIAPPSDVLVKVKKAYEYLINLKYSSWTLAPKEMVTF